MCDYSLHGIPSRLAEKDEVLVVHRFYTGSKGLTSSASLRPIQRPKSMMAWLTNLLGLPDQLAACAVCIPDGAKLMLHGISQRLQQAYRLNADEMITFRQLSMSEHTYRDAVEFRNGVRVRLQDLEEGQTVDVIALSLERDELQGKTLIPTEA